MEEGANVYIAYRSNTLMGKGALNKDEAFAVMAREAQELGSSIAKDFPHVKVLHILQYMPMVVVQIPKNVPPEEIEKKCNCRIAKDQKIKILL